MSNKCKSLSRLLVVDVQLEHDEVAGLVQAAHNVQRVARRRGVGLDRKVEQMEPLIKARRDLRIRVQRQTGHSWVSVQGFSPIGDEQVEPLVKARRDLPVRVETGVRVTARVRVGLLSRVPRSGRVETGGAADTGAAGPACQGAGCRV